MIFSAFFTLTFCVEQATEIHTCITTRVVATVSIRCPIHTQHMAVNITLGHRNVDVQRRFDWCYEKCGASAACVWH